MTTDMTKTIDEVRRTVEAGPAGRLLEQLVERIEGKAGVRAVFADPVDRGDITLIPVARVRWGFGAGYGSGPESADGLITGSGAGGGGGVTAEPAGYVEITPAGARFQSIRPPYPTPAFLIAAGLASAVVLRALARIAQR